MSNEEVLLKSEPDEQSLLSALKMLNGCKFTYCKLKNELIIEYGDYNE